MVSIAIRQGKKWIAAMSQQPELESRPAAAPPNRRFTRRFARAVVLYALVPYLFVTLLFAALQRQFLYPGRRAETSARPRSTAEHSPRDVQITTHDGLPLHGWLVSPREPAGAEPGNLVIFFPGNAENRYSRLADCRDFTAAGAQVLLFDYRGYGGNPGTPSEAALSHDARQVWQFAVEDLKFPPQRIVLFGESLGGAVATRLAAELCRDNIMPAGLLLNSTFASLAETVAWRYPQFPFQFLLLDRYPSAERIREVACPIVVFHGTDDDFVPLDQGRRLFNEAPPRSASGIEKQFIVLDGAGHNSLPSSAVRTALDEMQKTTIHNE
jgi:fermentation-respiration switch protein FrsA (DUF1100 family)